jgi:Oligosaccharyltransferase subunit Ribophorin II
LQDHKDIPPQLLAADTLKLSLILASFGESKPLKLQFATIQPTGNDSSRTKPEAPERWTPKPEITHTFKEPPKLPNAALSTLFAFAVLGGIPFFMGLVVAFL